MLFTWLALVLLGSALHLANDTSAPLPPPMAGIWATGASLYDGTKAQTEIHLAPDGFGILSGSSDAPTTRDGVASKELRVVMGLPVKATFADNTLSVRIRLSKDQQDQYPDKILCCDYKPAGSELVCTWPDEKTVNVKKRGEAIDDNTAQDIAILKKLLW